MKKLKQLDWGKVIFWFVFISLAVSIVFSIINWIEAPAELVDREPYEKVKSDYALIILQCLLGAIVMFLPSMLERKLNLEIPNYMYVLFVLFLYAAIYLGEVRDFFYHVPHFDTILHIFSGMMLGAFGFSVVDYLNGSNKVSMELSPLFVTVFSLCLAVTIGTLWEIYEYTFDGIFSLNMQKFMLEDGTQLIGRAALSDTMKDLIVDFLGALSVCIVGYVILRSNMKKRQEEMEAQEEEARLKVVSEESAEEETSFIVEQEVKGHLILDGAKKENVSE